MWYHRLLLVDFRCRGNCQKNLRNPSVKWLAFSYMRQCVQFRQSKWLFLLPKQVFNLKFLGVSFDRTTFQRPHNYCLGTSGNVVYLRCDHIAGFTSPQEAMVQYCQEREQGQRCKGQPLFCRKYRQYHHYGRNSARVSPHYIFKRKSRSMNVVYFSKILLMMTLDNFLSAMPSSLHAKCLQCIKLFAFDMTSPRYER